jgi:hypothetical protein
VPVEVGAGYYGNYSGINCYEKYMLTYSGKTMSLLGYFTKVLF